MSRAPVGWRVVLGALTIAAFHVGAGCSNDSSTQQDLGGTADLASTDSAQQQQACNGQAPTDGQSCGGGCGTGTMCAGYSASDLKCYQTCDVAAPACPCGRKCVAISGGSGGAACLPANSEGERCGDNGAGTTYGYGVCEQGLVCAGPPDGRYCVPVCVTSSTCAAQTSCKDVVDNMMVSNSVCWFNSSMTGVPVGGSCTNQTFCMPNSLCAEGMCRQQCGGAADPTCGSGTCTPLKDSNNLTFAYVCL